MILVQPEKMQEWLKPMKEASPENIWEWMHHLVLLPLISRNPTVFIPHISVIIPGSIQS